MDDENPRLVLKIETNNPIELRQFVGAFVGIGNQFELLYAREHGVAKGSARFFVHEVREGSIIAELVPYFLPATFGAGALLAGMKNANDLVTFVKNLRDGIGFLKLPKGRLPHATKGELADFLRTVEPIANDTNGSLSLAVYEDGEKRIAFQFDTSEARAAENNIIEQSMEMDQTDDADFKRVLMVFTRTNVAHAKTGKRSGELVEIETIYKKPLPIVYASSLAEERIRHEIADADENVYKKAFDVDVNVEMKGDRPVAFRLVAVHDVIDLPDED